MKIWETDYHREPGYAVHLLINWGKIHMCDFICGGNCFAKKVDDCSWVKFCAGNDLSAPKITKQILFLKH